MNIRGLVRETIPGSQEVYEFVVHRRRRRTSIQKLRQLRSAGGPIKLDIGGGGQAGSNGWLTIDTAEGCDLYWDLREGIPFPTGTVDAIYSSHLFEHLAYGDGQTLMADCLRALKPGGLFSIAVPNARMYVEAYLGQRSIPTEYFQWKPAYNGTTAIDAINYVAYMGGEHRYMFDSENLVARLTSVGFADVTERSFDPSLDLSERAFESIYAEGRKPL